MLKFMGGIGIKKTHKESRSLIMEAAEQVNILYWNRFAVVYFPGYFSVDFSNLKLPVKILEKAPGEHGTDALCDSPLVLQSDRNVTVNARNHMGQLTGQLTVGADAVEAQCKRFEVRARESGKVLFSADEDEIVIGADRLKVTGTEGAVFGHSVETPHIRAEPSQDLKLESPTRSLVMEAPRGVQVNAAAGDLKATCRKELHLQSTEGEIFLNADTIRLGNLPVGSFSSSSSSSSSPSSSAPRQTIYELCVCPNVLLGFPCDKFNASNGLQSNFFQCKQEYSAAFSCGLCCHST
nr:zeta-sarcoglycan isoform X3 [Columba livia]XP_021141572.1 zeta-sarcoglycan isoform X3 [Columba livia]